MSTRYHNEYSVSVIRIFTRVSWIRLLIFVVSLFVSKIQAEGGKTVSLERGDSCTTPDGKSATCVPLNTCRVVFDAVSSPSKDDKVFAGKSFCGFDNDTLVCCECPGPAITVDFETNALPDRKTCGIVKEEPRIIGGEVAQLGEFPWMAAIEYKSKRSGENAGIRCGGTVINNKYILTVAHCLIDREFEPINVWLGEWKISTDPDCKELIANVECADPIQKFKIKESIPNLFYTKRNGYNDIGLLLLEKEIKFSDYIKPICLSSPILPSPELGTRMTAAGWGATENGTSSDILLKVKVPLLSSESCTDKLSHPILDTYQFCAGGEEGKDTCQGDTGGPLMRIYEDKVNGQINWYQEGIPSYGVGCGRIGYPAIYTRISAYMDWIISVISKE